MVQRFTSVRKVWFVFIMFMVSYSAYSQSFEEGQSLARQAQIDSLEKSLDELFGKDKLVVLNQVVALYLANDKPKTALRFATRAEELAEAVITRDNVLINESDYYLKPLSYLWLGQANMRQGYYLESRQAFDKAVAAAKEFNSPILESQAREYLIELDSLSASSKEKKRLFGGKIRDITGSVGDAKSDFGLSATLKLAANSEKSQNYPKAIAYYESAIDQLRDEGDWRKILELREQIADLYQLAGNYRMALEGYEGLLTDKSELGDSVGVVALNDKINRIHEEANPGTEREVASDDTPAIALTPEEIDLSKKEEEVMDVRVAAEQAESNQDFEASLNYYKQYVALQDRLAEEKRLQELALLEKAHQIENQEREITLLKQDDEIRDLEIQRSQAQLEEQRAFRQNLTIGIVLLAGIVFTLYLMYRNKRRDHRKLGAAYRDLESTQEQLKEAEQRIMSLLHQQVSGAVANELLSTDDERKIERRFVCIMFLDIRDFTPFAEQRRPEEIIDYQNKVFGFMIRSIEEKGGIVNQIMGDGFMATFGAPTSSGNDCLQAYLAAK